MTEANRRPSSKGECHQYTISTNAGIDKSVLLTTAEYEKLISQWVEGQGVVQIEGVGAIKVDNIRMIVDDNVQMNRTGEMNANLAKELEAKRRRQNAEGDSRRLLKQEIARDKRAEQG